jgi:hypothetical protein
LHLCGCRDQELLYLSTSYVIFIRRRSSHVILVERPACITGPHVILMDKLCIHYRSSVMLYRGRPASLGPMVLLWTGCVCTSRNITRTWYKFRVWQHSLNVTGSDLVFIRFCSRLLCEVLYKINLKLFKDGGSLILLAKFCL